MEAGAITTVLVVDDEDPVRSVAGDILELDGFHVLGAGNSQEALLCLENAPEVKVLFTDVNMPGAPNGLGLAKLVSERWPHIRILVASGNVSPGPEDLPPGGLFLRKPYGLTSCWPWFTSSPASEPHSSWPGRTPPKI